MALVDQLGFKSLKEAEHFMSTLLYEEKFDIVRVVTSFEKNHKTLAYFVQKAPAIEVPETDVPPAPVEAEGE